MNVIHRGKVNFHSYFNLRLLAKLTKLIKCKTLSEIFSFGVPYSVIRVENENCYLKVFYKFFTSNLLKLLQKAKNKLKFFIFLGLAHLFRARNPKKGHKRCDELKQKDKRF